MLDTEKLSDKNILSLIFPLLKPGKNLGNPASYCPVALTELLVRVLGKVLQQVMQRQAEKYNLFSKVQHEFRHKISTISNILKSQQRIQEELVKGKKVDSIFLNLLEALDKVPTTLLIRRLIKCVFC